MWCLHFEFLKAQHAKLQSKESKREDKNKTKQKTDAETIVELIQAQDNLKFLVENFIEESVR